MRRLVVLATTVALATCQPGDEIASGSPAGDAASALLVVDLDPLVADTNDATSVRLTVNSEAVAELTLPARGDVLEGHAAWPVAAGVEVRVGLELLNGKVAWPGPTTQIQVATGEAVRLRATIDGRGRPMLVENARVLLGSSDGATVDYAASERGQAWQSRLGQRPVASLVGILADPQIAVVTPTSSQGSDASAIGPLVAWRHLETAVARTSVESQPSMDHPVPAYLRYYSYCSCGRAAVDREYELCTPDGRKMKGQTDRFGMIMVPGVAQALVHFGPSQRERKRNYPFIAGEPETRDNILNALGAEDPNDVLTALLDLQAQPLPAAKERLLRLLQHDNPVIWRNAAITLSRYPDGGLAGLMALGAPTRDDAGLQRHLTIHGALRHPEAVGWLAKQLKEGNPAARAISAWGIGFIGHPRGLDALERAASDPDAAVRAAVALALGRLGRDSALSTLETLMGDAEARVADRAAEAVRLLQM